MEIGLAAILVDIAITVSGWLRQGIVGKRDRKTLELVASLQSLGADDGGSALRDARLVGAMKGALTVPLARQVMGSVAFRGLCQEVFLSELTDASDARKNATCSSFRATFRSVLSDRVNKEHLRHFSDFVYHSIRETSAAWINDLRRKHPEALSSISTMASARRINSTLDAIETRLASIQYFDRRPDQRELQELWIAKYVPQVIHAHGYIQPPDFNNSRKIPVDSLYVSPKFIEETDGGKSTLDFGAIVDCIDRTVILGDPGGGKSTFSAVLAVHVLKAGGPRIIPFHVTLRDFVKLGDHMSVVDFINMQLSSRYQSPAPEKCVEGLLLSGEALVIFDGLDELIDTTKRRLVTNQVEAFGIAYPLAKILVTSRKVGYAEAKVDPSIFGSFELGDFDEKDVGLYVSKWFESQGEGDFAGADPEELASSFLAQSEAVPDLRRNPLMLSLMCIIFKGENFIPRSRPEVYKKCANLLFEKWDGHRSIEVPLKAKDYIDPAMKFFAHWMLTSNQAESGVPYNLLVSKMTEYLHLRAFNDPDEALRAAEEFIEFCQGRAWVFSDAGTTPSGESLWKFTHRTFMEYFAAAHLNRLYDPEKLARELLPRVAAQEWDVISQLAVQIANDREKGSERVLTVMLDDGRRRTEANRSNVLSFIARCMDFAVVSEAFVQRLTDIGIRRFNPQREFGNRWIRDFGISPFISLIENGSRYNKAIQRQIADTFSDGIASNDQVSRANLAYLALCCTDLANLQPRFGIHSKNLLEWVVFFRQVAAGHIDALTQECVANPAMNIYLIIAGLENPQATLERAVSSGHDLGSILFSGDENWLNGEALSLNGYIIRQVFTRDLSDDLLQEDLVRVADTLVESTEQYLRSDPRFCRSAGPYGPFFVPAVETLPSFIVSNPNLLAAVLISLLALFEGMVAARFDLSMLERKQVDDAMGALYALRMEAAEANEVPLWFRANIREGWLLTFLVDWARGKENIYSWHD